MANGMEMVFGHYLMDKNKMENSKMSIRMEMEFGHFLIDQNKRGNSKTLKEMEMVLWVGQMDKNL